MLKKSYQNKITILITIMFIRYCFKKISEQNYNFNWINVKAAINKNNFI